MYALHTCVHAPEYILYIHTVHAYIHTYIVTYKLGVAPKYLMDHIHSTLSATSHRPLRSSDWHVLFVLRVMTAMAQSRSSATIGPSLWNALPSSLHLTLCCLDLVQHPYPF